MKDEMLHELMNGFSKGKAVSMAHSLLNDIESMNQILSFCQLNEPKLSARASWVFQEMVKLKHPVNSSQLRSVIELLQHSSIDGVKRNFLSALQLLEIPEEVIGELSDYCFSVLLSSKETVAVKVYAMQIAANACKRYPELKSELLSCIEMEMSKNTIAFFARAKRVRKELELI